MGLITSAIVGGLAAIGGGSAIAGGLLAVGAAATVGSLVATNRAAREQRRMNEFQRRQADLAAARQRRDTVRQNRMSRSQAVLTANAQGVSQSSGAMGGQDSILAQGYSNLSFMDTQNTLSDQASSAYGKAIGFQNQANMFSGIASLAMSFYSPPVKADAAVAVKPGLSPSQWRALTITTPKGK